MQVGGIGNCWYTLHIAARYLENWDYEEEEDSRAAKAKEQGLTVWVVRPRGTMIDPFVDEDKRILLIGTQLALIGDGGPDSAHLPPEEVLEKIEETETKLKLAGIRQKPKLWAHCDIDFAD